MRWRVDFQRIFVNQTINDASLFLLAMCHQTDDGEINANNKNKKQKKKRNEIEKQKENKKKKKKQACIQLISLPPPWQEGENSKSREKGEEGGKREKKKFLGKFDFWQ